MLNKESVLVEKYFHYLILLYFMTLNQILDVEFLSLITRFGNTNNDNVLTSHINFELFCLHNPTNRTSIGQT